MRESNLPLMLAAMQLRDEFGPEGQLHVPSCCACFRGGPHVLAFLCSRNVKKA